MADDEQTTKPLKSRSSAGAAVAGLLGSLEATVTNRPRPVTQIEERYRDPWATVNGVTIEGLDDAPEREEPPDRSGARV